MQSENLHSLHQLPLLDYEEQHCFFVYLKIIALPFFAYLYFILGYIGVLNFRVGEHSVILIGLIFLVSLLFARHNGEFGACYFRRHANSFRGELKEYIGKNMMHIGSHTKSNASFDDFMNHYSKRIRNDNYASVGAGIFPTMGILGTFISIALTMPDFASQTADALEREISLLLSGVGTAFYVSIYGILLSLWWIFFEKRGLSRFDRDVESIKADTMQFFWTKEEIEQAYLRENLQHFEKIGHMFERLSSNDFFERLGKTIESKFNLFDEMLKLEAQSVKMGATHLKEGMEALARSQEKQRDLGFIHENILGVLKQFNETTKELHNHISHEIKSILNSNTVVCETFKESVQSTVSHLSYISSNLEHSHKTLLDEYTHSLNDIKEGIMSRLDSPLQHQEVESLKESLKKIDAETEDIIQKMDALK